MGWFKQSNESEEEKELWREYDYWNYRYDTAKTNEDVCKAYDELEKVKDKLREVRGRY